MVIKRFDVVMGCSEEGIYDEECDTGEYVRHTDHAAEVARLEQELENIQNKHDALADSLTRNNALWHMDSNAMEGIRDERDSALAEVARMEAERDAALAEVAKMRPVVESAVRWLSDLTEYAELELERAARDYRDKEAEDADKG